MKKLVTLLTMLVLGISGMWAADVTPVTALENGKYYLKMISSGSERIVYYDSSSSYLIWKNYINLNSDCQVFIFTQGTGTYAGRYTIQTSDGKYVTYTSVSKGDVVRIVSGSDATDSNKWWVLGVDGSSYDIYPWRDGSIATDQPAWNMSVTRGGTANAAVGLYSGTDGNSKVTLKKMQKHMLASPEPSNGSFAANTIWYTISIKDGNYIYNQGDASNIALSRKTTSYGDDDLWCFVGDLNNGYKIYNKGAGTGKFLSASTTMSGTTGGGTYAIVQAEKQGNNTTWDFSIGNTINNRRGYFIGQHSYPSKRMNQRNDKLAFWTEGADDGSTFVIKKVEEYNIRINGGGENGRIIIDGTEYANGTKFFRIDDAEFTPVAKIISYYHAGDISISENTISLDYEITVPDGYNGFIAGKTNINEDDWKNPSNWSLTDTWKGNGPGCNGSDMWSPIYLLDITSGTIPSTQDNKDNIYLEGWTFRMTANHSTFTINQVKKIQSDCYLTLKNTSVVTMNFGNGQQNPFTVNLDEGTGNKLNFKFISSNGFNSTITVNYGRITPNTNRVFNAEASDSRTIKSLVINANLTNPTAYNTLESIPLVTLNNVNVTNVNTDGIVATGWTSVDSKAALETQTTSGMYYFLEKSDNGVTLYTYNKQTLYYISSGTENLSSIENLSQYTEINVASGAKLNVDQGLNKNVSGEGEIDFIASTKEIENATIKGVIITSSGHIAPKGTVTLDGITNNITNDDNGYAFVGSSDVTMNLKGTMDLSSTSIGLSSGSWIIIDGNITLAGILNSSETVGNNTSLEVKQNSTLTVDIPTSGTSFNIIRNVINAGTINFNGDVKNTIAADITGTVNIASEKKWILTNEASGQHVWSAIRGSAGDGTLQVPAGKEIISWAFPGSITVNVKKLVFDGSGDVICCGTYETNNSSFTIPTGKTVQASNAMFWNKRSYLNVYGTLESANLKMGHEENGNYPGTTTIFNGGVLKTGDIIYKNKATNNEIIVNEGGTLEFSSITKEDTQQMTANMKLTATNATLKMAALPATKDGDDYVIAQSGTFSISGTPLTVGETNYGISVADNKALVKAYNLTVGSTGYATLCLPYKAIIPSGIYAYKAQLAENTVSLTKINQTEGLILPQETGVVINSEPGEYEFIAGFGTAISVTDNSLVGLTEDTTLPQGAYILTKSGDKAVFKQATGTLKANKAYLNAGSNSRQQLSIIWTGDDPTGISSIFNTNNPEDGKFFHNGRIVIVKDGIMYNVAGQMMK